MSIYRDKCDEIQRIVRRVTKDRAFGARFGVIAIESDVSVPGNWEVIQYVEDKFFVDIYIIAKKLRELLDKEENGNDEPIERPEACGIKGMRDEALMYLYKRYNILAGLDEIDYGAATSMKDLICEIEKLEHARHMEASDEIAKMSIEKLEKFARPMPDIKMDVKQFEDIAKDNYGKKGAKE